MDVKLFLSNISKDNFIHNLKILFIFYRMGSYLDQGTIDACTQRINQYVDMYNF